MGSIERISDLYVGIISNEKTIDEKQKEIDKLKNVQKNLNEIIAKTRKEIRKEIEDESRNIVIGNKMYSIRPYGDDDISINECDIHYKTPK